MSNPEIKIQVDGCMPLGELISESKSPNKSVKRSAHVGNMFGADLILTSMGMDTLLVDANYGDRDKLYFPHLIVDESNQPQEIACPRTLSLVNATYDGTSLGAQCTRSIEMAFGNTVVYTDEEFVQSNRCAVETIVSVLLKDYGALFTRTVDSTGKPRDLVERPASIEDVFLLGECPAKGALIPNAMNILIDFVVEAMKYGTSGITHISGPTMVRYIGGIMPQMNAMYSLLVASGLPLPEKLNVRLVPAAGVKFVISAARSDALNEIISTIASLESITAVTKIAKKELALSGKKPVKADFDAITAPEKAVKSGLKALALDAPELFYTASPEANTPTYTSQYSAIRCGADGSPGSGLCIPALVLERPVDEITTKFELLDTIRRS